MKAFARFLCVLSLTAFCVACGGGGGGTAPPTPLPPVTNASPGGIWVGIDADGGQIVAFVTETGGFHFIDEFLNQGSGILTVSNGNDVSGNFQLVSELGFTFPDGTTLADCTLSGTVTERQTLTVTVNCTTTAGNQDQITVTLDYVPIYERDSSLATIAGTFDDGSGIVTNIASDGTIFEQDPVSGCVTNGQVSVIDNGAFNLYGVQFGFNNCTGQLVGTFAGLGDLLGGNFSSRAFGVSVDGRVVVGESTSASGTEAFRLTSGGGMVGLGALAGGSFSQARGVSADGSVVVGISDSSQAFQWKDGVMTGLGFLPGEFSSQAWNVSANGSVVVGSSGRGGNTVPVRWDNGLIAELGGTGIAFDVSADGAVVVGSVNTPFSEAFRWENGVMTNLGFLPGRLFSRALGVSADGSVVVGSSAGGLAGEEAFRWENGVMVSLGSLGCPQCIPSGQISSEAHAVSADGSVVVGSSFGEPFIWDAAHGMRRLDDVFGFGLDLSGWTFCCNDFVGGSTTISADGLTIVGTGRNPNGEIEAWIAVLRPFTFAILNGTSFVGTATLDNTVTPEVLIVAATGDVAGTLVSFVSVLERL